MLESNENNGVHHDNGINGNGAEAAKPRKKRVLTKDLSARIAELEKKLEANGEAKPSDLEQKLAEMTDQIAKLDERVSKIAHAVAQFNLTRPGALA
jgi:predicted RNase H-like nuclease (RuvC/YqgF family)